MSAKLKSHGSFTFEVSDKLRYYVYRLIDPRNGQTFYVGKGKGNRVFAHAKGESDIRDDNISDKLQRIRDIRLSGFEVAHVIHRHGMDEKTAFEVEAALIDSYPEVINCHPMVPSSSSIRRAKSLRLRSYRPALNMMAAFIKASQRLPNRLLATVSLAPSSSGCANRRWRHEQSDTLRDLYP